MSTLNARLKMKLLMRAWPPVAVEKSRWLPSMSPMPAACVGFPEAAGWAAPDPLRQGRAPNPYAPLSPDAAPNSRPKSSASAESSAMSVCRAPPTWKKVTPQTDIALLSADVRRDAGDVEVGLLVRTDAAEVEGDL